MRSTAWLLEVAIFAVTFGAELDFTPHANSVRLIRKPEHACNVPRTSSTLTRAPS